MGKQQDHIQQWQHNRDFLGGIDATFTDWIVTVSFYVALQAVDALFAHDGVREPTSHDLRNEVLRVTNRYKAIWIPYQGLYDLSRTTRYLANPQCWVPPEKIVPDVFKRLLYPIERSAQKLMKLELGFVRDLGDPRGRSGGAPVPSPQSS